MEEMHHSEKRFGVVAVERGLITGDQLYQALKSQVDEDLDWGRHRPLGEILHQQGAMTRAQIDEVLEALEVLADVFD
jgi:chorismate-pyruvate lyase